MVALVEGLQNACLCQHASVVLHMDDLAYLYLAADIINYIAAVVVVIAADAVDTAVNDAIVDSNGDLYAETAAVAVGGSYAAADAAVAFASVIAADAVLWSHGPGPGREKKHRKWHCHCH